jgi:hypothetical protein
MRESEQREDSIETASSTAAWRQEEQPGRAVPRHRVQAIAKAVA